MKRLIAALSLCAGPALAGDTDISSMIADQGLAATAAHLAALPAPTGEERMALAATRFLAGIEAAYQARWRVGATETIAALPVLATPLEPNPTPEPLTADFLNAIARDLSTGMDAARAPLAQPFSSEDALVLRLDDLWFDIDGNGQRSEDEGFYGLLQWGLGVPEAAPEAREIRFDAADARWLDAYTHLIGGMAELVLAFDPAPEIASLIDTRTQLAAQWDEKGSAAGLNRQGAMLDAQFGGIIDNAATLIDILRHQPDPARIGKAETHIRAMIAQNRAFWTEVALETDNDREWIPNAAQTAAMGFEMPPETGPVWLDVLEQAEQAMDGQLLIPYWRFAPGHGIDLSKWLAEPAPVELTGWITGRDALPYAGKGPLMTSDAIARFERLFGGRTPLFMALLN